MRSEHVTRTPTNGSSVLLSRVPSVSRDDLYTELPLEAVFVTWYDRIFYIDMFLYRFDTVLYWFLETGTSDICVIGIDNSRDFHFSFYFSFTVPLSVFLKTKIWQLQRFKGFNKKRGMSILSLKYLEKHIKYLTILKYLVRYAWYWVRASFDCKNSFLIDYYQNYKVLQKLFFLLKKGISN